MNIQSSIRERLPSTIQVQTSQIKSEKEDDDLVCPICSYVIWEPVGCAVCKLHVCLKCIQDWQNKGKTTCPISGCKEFQDEKPHPYFYKHLSSLKLDCQNKEKGCLETMLYEQYQKHLEKECMFVDVNCPDEGCQIIILKKDLEEHLKVCEYFLVKCEYCENDYYRKDKKDHEEYVCQNYPVKCDNEQCQEIVKRVDLKKHLLNCLYKLDICNYCQQVYNQTQKHLHEQNCQERKLKCKGCKCGFKQFELKDHQKQCNQIKFKCKLCLQEFPQFEFNDQHNKEKCMEHIILNLQKENQILKDQNQQLMQQQKTIEQKLDQIMNVSLLNRNSQSEVLELESLIEECYQKIMQILDQQQFLNHQKKKHSFTFTDVHLALKHFQFLNYSSILYNGWGKLHCSDCFNYVKKIEPLIAPLLATIANSENQIKISKYYHFNNKQNSE
ncbi:hypothetical protein ABPG74_015502 [Tetrahymena malaccensis]